MIFWCILGESWPFHNLAHSTLQPFQLQLLRIGSLWFKISCVMYNRSSHSLQLDFFVISIAYCIHVKHKSNVIKIKSLKAKFKMFRLGTVSVIPQSSPIWNQSKLVIFSMIISKCSNLVKELCIHDCAAIWKCWLKVSQLHRMNNKQSRFKEPLIALDDINIHVSWRHSSHLLVLLRKHFRSFVKGELAICTSVLTRWKWVGTS